MNRSNLLWLYALPIALLLLAGCDSVNVDPNNILVGPGRDRRTVANLITKYFPFVYAESDSAGYETTLDEAYTFELLDEEPDPDFPEGWWDKIEELSISGNMFKGRANPVGQTVEDIGLTLQIKSNVVDNHNYPEKPPGETWYRVTTYVDLRVIADDPIDPSGVMNFLVDSEQIFVCRPDPDADSLWVIYRQMDQSSINKGRPAALAGTDNTSWGSVKMLWSF